MCLYCTWSFLHCPIQTVFFYCDVVCVRKFFFPSTPFHYSVYLYTVCFFVCVSIFYGHTHTYKTSVPKIQWYTCVCTYNTYTHVHIYTCMKRYQREREKRFSLNFFFRAWWCGVVWEVWIESVNRISMDRAKWGKGNCKTFFSLCVYICVCVWTWCLKVIGYF